MDGGGLPQRRDDAKEIPQRLPVSAVIFLVFTVTALPKAPALSSIYRLVLIIKHNRLPTRQ